MRKIIGLLIAFGLVVAACGSTPETSTQPAPTASTEAPVESSPDPTESTSDTEASTESTEAMTESTAADPGDDEPARVAEGPDVPGVLLALDNGDTIDVANADRPLMLVFWAEW